MGSNISNGFDSFDRSDFLYACSVDDSDVRCRGISAIDSIDTLKLSTTPTSLSFNKAYTNAIDYSIDSDRVQHNGQRLSDILNSILKDYKCTMKVPRFLYPSSLDKLKRSDLKVRF